MSAEDNSWVFDSLVAFLNGPIWNAPLQSFIEERSLIFEPNVIDSEEYRTIFDEFKNLVDFMLGNFMEDIKITPDQFQDACTEGKRYHLSFDNSIFEQIWAANDYQMFVRMMTQRNLELQLQALELIEKKYGITPESFKPSKNENVSKDTKSIPVTVELESKLEKKILEEVSKRFAQEEPTTSSAEMENLIEQKPILEKKLKETLRQEKKEDIAEGQSTKVNNTQEIDSLEMKKRQDYLKAQRDKLVAMKKEARQKHLASETLPKSKNRPKSAKAAEAVLSGEQSNIEASQLQIRKTLAERLKAEVVDKNKK